MKVFSGVEAQEREKKEGKGFWLTAFKQRVGLKRDNKKKRRKRGVLAVGRQKMGLIAALEQEKIRKSVCSSCAHTKKWVWLISEKKRRER